MRAAAPYVPRALLHHLSEEPERRVRPVDGTCVLVDVSFGSCPSTTKLYSLPGAGLGFGAEPAVATRQGGCGQRQCADGQQTKP